MTILMIGILMGLGVGFLIGFCLGLEDRRRCAVCLSEGAAQHRNGYLCGWRDAIDTMSARLRSRHTEDQTGRVRIHPATLERLEKDLKEIGEI